MTLRESFDFDARETCRALSAMELPHPDAAHAQCEVTIHHPGGVGDILTVADGGSWLRGQILPAAVAEDAVQVVAIA